MANVKPQKMKTKRAPGSACNPAGIIFKIVLNKCKGHSSKVAIMKINTLMKSLTTTTALIALTLLGAAPKSEAGCEQPSRVYISSYQSCGTPIYTERYFIGYDRCGNPVWGTRVVRSYYRPVVRPRYVAPRPDYSYSSYNYGSSNRRGRVQFGASYCR